MKGSILVDSGAFSLYQFYSKKGSSSSVKGSTWEDRKYDNFDYIKTKKYKKYRKAYGDFLIKNKGVIDTAINLDVINNPKETYRNQKYFEKRGISVIPVYHLNTDITYLEKYLTEGHKHLALAGMVPNPFKKVKPVLDRVWDKYLTDKDGFPLVKVHGLAITSPIFLFSYPWYSVDSSGWVWISSWGGILVPKTKLGKHDYSKSPIYVCVTEGRVRKKSTEDIHINNLSEIEQKAIRKFIKDKGFVYGKSKFKTVDEGYEIKDNETFLNKEKTRVEVVIEEGISNSNFQRDLFNATYYQDLADSIGPYPWAFKAKKGLFI